MGTRLNLFSFEVTRHMIRSVMVSIWVVFITLFCAPIAVVASLLKKGGNFSHLVGRFWSQSILFVSGVKVSVRGLHHIEPHATYIYMPNHQSMYDILALLGHLPVQFRWLAKKELFEIPLFGYSMARVGYISIDRSNWKSAHKSLVEAAKKVATGVSVVVFPEGSRSMDGQLKAFKSGGFRLAIQSGQPIVPVAIHGTRQVMQKGSLRITPGHVIVSINPPMDTASYTNKTKKVLMESVRSIIKEDLDKIAMGLPRGLT